MASLNPTLALAPGESIMSFVSRLAQLHHVPAAQFRRDLGLSRKGLVDGEEETLRRLAALSGASIDHLENCAIRRDGMTYSLGGEIIGRSSLRRERLFVCAKCIEEDVARDGPQAAYGRVTWLLEPMTGCGRHGIVLKEVPVARSQDHDLSGHEPYDFAENVAPKLAHIQALSHKCPAQSPSALDSYLTHRLNGEATDCWLNNLTWSAAANTALAVGTFALHGVQQRINELSDEDLLHAGDAGFYVCKDGADGIRTFLAHLDQGFSGTQQAEGPQAVYGQMVRWAYNKEEEYEPFLAILREHIWSRFPIAQGEPILGVATPKRRIHSIASAAKEYDIHPKRLRKTLFALDVVPASLSTTISAHCTFDAEVHAPLLERIASSITRQEAQAYLGADRVHAALLAKHGYIVPIVPPRGNGLGEERYAPADLDAFLQRLLAEARPCSPDGDIMNIPAAAKRANCKATQILELILNGDVKFVGKAEGEKGYFSACVSLKEIKSHLHGEPLCDLTARDVQILLKKPAGTIKALIERKILPTYDAIHPINRCPVRLVPKAAVDDFVRTYAALSDLAQAAGCGCVKLYKRLTDQAIMPALAKKDFGTNFYLRSETW